LTNHIAENAYYTDAQRADLHEVGPYAIANFETDSLSYARLMELTRELVERAPIGSRIIFVTDHKQAREDDGSLTPLVQIDKLAGRYREMALDYPFVETASFDEVIRSDEEIQIGGNHYNREVYLRLAELLAARASTMPRRTADFGAVATGRARPINYSFGLGGNSPALGVGWDNVESQGRWMVGDVSELTIDTASLPDGEGTYFAELDLWPTIVRHAIDEQRLIITMGNKRLLRTSVEERQTIRFRLGAKSDIESAGGRLFFIHPDAVAPIAVGNGQDPRRLSLMVFAMRIRRKMDYAGWSD
jgi:hypothetical protein